MKDRRDLLPVMLKMYRIAERAGIELRFVPHDIPIPCLAGLGYGSKFELFTDNNTGQRFGRVTVAYHVDQATPEDLFWSFGHELGHAMQWKRGWPIMDGALDPLRQAREVDAWDYAKMLADLTDWPTNARFERTRAISLSTYGVVERAPVYA